MIDANTSSRATQTMTPFALEKAAKTLLASVIAEGRWLPALEVLMGEMNVLGGGIARTAPPKMFAIPSSGVRQPFADFQAGKAPTLTPSTPMAPSADTGFIADHMTVTKEIRDRDPFYQEFLRPRHCVHQTSALLDETSDGAVRALIFRTEKQGRFEPDELKSLDFVLPYLRSAAMFARGALQGEARKEAERFERRGEPVISLSAQGNVLEMNAAAEAAQGKVFSVQNGRIVATAGPEKNELDRALRAACRDGHPDLVTLTTVAEEERYRMLFIPVQGHARDVFHGIAALAVVVENKRPRPAALIIDLLCRERRLTRREAEVVYLIVAGEDLKEVAKRQSKSLETFKGHIQRSFDKLEVHSREELTDVVRRLS